MINHLRAPHHHEVARVDHRRGVAHQLSERALEQTVRAHVAQITIELRNEGLASDDVADLLDRSPRTLRQWRHDFAAGVRPPCPLGRPVLRSSRQQRNDVIHLIDEAGPAIGVPALREAFPDMPRAELDDLLTRYRRLWRRRNHEPLRVLHWHTPGRVWAIDFTGPRPAIEGTCPYLLAVRDLASGRQLLWAPAAEATARIAADALMALFMTHGAPLVLKCDNGSPFTSGTVRQLNHDFAVEMLFSPPGMPRYNGAIEAGIGSLKTRTQHHAARHGRPGEWTFDDLAAAQAEANSTAWPRGQSGPTPNEAWSTRTMWSADERTLFRAEVERQRSLIDAQERPNANPQTDLTAKATDRQAMRRALEGLGYLTYTRRRIALPISSRKVATIT